MGDLDKNIHRREDAAPYGEIVVNPIEKERKEKEGYADLQYPTQSQSVAILFSWFRKILNTLSNTGAHLAFSGDLSHLLDTVTALRQHLLVLAAEDQSHNPVFMEELPELWHNLLDHCNSLSSLQGPAPEILNKVRFLISQIENFPHGADHTLGQYFTQYAGKDWIPFPFMELLQGLHEEYIAAPNISVLHNWLLLLEEILFSAGVKK